VINQINVAGTASYSATGEQIRGLRSINFIYGANGSGKTTLSRLINEPANFPTCSLIWANNTPITSLVY